MINRDAILEQLKNEIQGLRSGPSVSKVGEVIKAGDGVATIRGLSEAKALEMLEFEAKTGEKILGLVLNLEEDSVGAIILGDEAKITEFLKVTSTGNILSIPISESVIGRVIDPLGNPLDGGPAIAEEKRYPLEKIASGVISRESVKTPLHTGIKAIDAMIPIGRGQRELIIGDRQIGKTAIAIDTIVHQGRDTRHKTPICVYVAIGQKESKIAHIVEYLKETCAMEYSVVVAASSSVPAALQYLAPYAGCAVGEYFMDQGKDALVVYDDL